MYILLKVLSFERKIALIGRVKEVSIRKQKSRTFKENLDSWEVDI